MLEINDVTEAVIGEAIAVHRELGPGLLESTYESCLASLLFERGLSFQRQAPRSLIFRGVVMDGAYRVDLLVEDLVVVELKTVRALSDVHFAQMMTYLKLTECEIGLLINFNVTRLKDGIRRVIRSRRPSA